MKLKRKKKKSICVFGLIFLLVLWNLDTGTMHFSWVSDFRPNGAYVDEVKFVMFDDLAQAMVALQNGEVDALDGQVPPNALPIEITYPNISVNLASSKSFKHLNLNCGRFPTNITAFRRAIAFGLDKSRIINTCTGGVGLPLDSFIPPILAEWQVEDLLDEHFYTANPLSGNISLDNAGFRDLDGDGWREYDQNRNNLWDPEIDLDDENPILEIKLLVEQTNEVDIVICNLVRLDLEALGIHASTVILDSAALLQHVHDGNFGGVCSETVLESVNSASFLYSYFRTGQEFCDTFLQFNNATINGLLDTMTTSSDYNEVKEKATAAHLLLTYEQPIITCYSEPYINAYRTDKFTGFFEYRGNGFTRDNSYCGIKVYLHDSLGGPFGGTFHMAFSEAFVFPNILHVNDRSTDMILGYIFEKLWQIDPTTLDPIPGLAYNWAIEATNTNFSQNILEGQKWTFSLYENASWHDGHPFTSADVQFSFETIWRSKEKYGINNIYRYDTPDEHTIIMYTTQQGYFDWGLTTGLYILPKHLWEKVENFTEWASSVNAIVGSGPFKWGQYLPDEYLTLLRHPEWHWDVRNSTSQTTSSTTSTVAAFEIGDFLLGIPILLVFLPKKRRNI